MSIKIKEKSEGVADEVSVGLVNRKLESFVEIVMKKMIELQQENKKLKARVSKLEGRG